MALYLIVAPSKGVKAVVAEVEAKSQEKALESVETIDGMPYTVYRVQNNPKTFKQTTVTTTQITAVGGGEEE